MSSPARTRSPGPVPRLPAPGLTPSLLFLDQDVRHGGRIALQFGVAGRKGIEREEIRDDVAVLLRLETAGVVFGHGAAGNVPHVLQRLAGPRVDEPFTGEARRVVARGALGLEDLLAALGLPGGVNAAVGG